MNRHAIYAELGKIASECERAGWDGYGADQVNPLTIAAARDFADQMPDETPQPSVGADPDGAVTFEWHAADRCTISVSVEPNGTVCFAALLGEWGAHGEMARSAR